MIEGAGTVAGMHGPDPDHKGSYRRSAGLLSVALALGGLSTYGFFALAAHALDREDYGLIVVLWTVQFVAISILFRPVEQLLSRTVAELEERGQATRRALSVATQIQAAVALVFVVAAFSFRGPIERDLFGGDGVFFWALVASILGFGASFYVRGLLAGRGRFEAFAWLVIVDAVSRAAFALVVAVGLASGPTLIALGIAIAPALSVAIVPFFKTKPTLGKEPAARSGDPLAQEAGAFSLAQGGGFAAAILVIMLSEQAFLNSGILVVRGEQGVAAAGLIFNVFMVIRAPVVLFQAVSTSLLPHLTRLRAAGRATSVEAFDDTVRTTLAAVAGFTAIVVLLMAAAGPTIMQLAFSDKFDYERVELILVAGGMGLFLGATTLSQAILARGAARGAAASWGLAAVVLLAISALPTDNVGLRVEVAFVAGAVCLAVLLTLAYRRIEPDAHGVEPGSPSEIEARLAVAEAGG